MGKRLQIAVTGAVIPALLISGCAQHIDFNYVPKATPAAGTARYPKLKVAVVSGWDARPIDAKENQHTHDKCITHELHTLTVKGLVDNLRASRLFDTVYLNPPVWSDIDVVAIVHLFSAPNGSPRIHIDFFTPHQGLAVSPIESELWGIGGDQLDYPQFQQVYAHFDRLGSAVNASLEGGIPKDADLALADERERDYFRLLDPELDSLRLGMQLAIDKKDESRAESLRRMYEDRLDQLQTLRLMEQQVCSEYSEASERRVKEETRLINDARKKYFEAKLKADQEEAEAATLAILLVLAAAAASYSSSQGGMSSGASAAIAAAAGLAVANAIEVSEEASRILSELRTELRFDMGKIEAEPQLRDRLERYPEYKDILAWDVWDYRLQFLERYHKRNALDRKLELPAITSQPSELPSVTRIPVLLTPASTDKAVPADKPLDQTGER